MAASAAICATRPLSRKNPSLWQKILLQRGQGVSITRGRCVLRNAEGFADLCESEIVPDFHDQNLPLLVRQTAERASKEPLRIVIALELRLNRLDRIGVGFGFASGPAAILSDEIKRDCSDGGIE